MSTTVDQRVVEMRFDNKNFESNVSTTMSTLDKLKQKLNFTGASNGLENIGSAAKRIDMSGLSNGVDTISSRFSALEVIGVTALANITNSAVNAGKRIISALTIDPVKTGFEEYETQINATQTILANTKSKGSTIDDVNKALDELNKYADLTIYNFTEMTRNIGTFTAAGIDLETSVTAIQGIANLAAVSGSTSQQASTAMYQLSQALAAGTVKLMDWNSVVNAGMGGEMFQNALKETSELLGTGAEAAIAAEGSFRESLRTGWLTSEVLTETLKKFTSSGAIEMVAEYTGLSQEAVQTTLDAAEAQYGEADAIEQASKALAEKSGKSAEEIKSTLEFAQTAQDAATKVKTFTQLWDVLKESAQSGWSATWKLLVGDFEQAKALLTPLADTLTGFINKMSDWRNDILESALGKSFSSLGEQIDSFLKPMESVSDAVDTVSSALKDYDTLVTEIIRGDWGNAPTRWQDLAAAGYDWAYAQNLVNERLGDSTRHATTYSEAQESVAEAQAEVAKTTGELTEEDKKRLIMLGALSDAELKEKGYTEEQIAALRELEATAKRLGLSLGDFLDNLDEINGRWIMINSFKNIGKSLISIFSAIGNAWKNTFTSFTKENIAESLFNGLISFHRITANLLNTINENSDQIERTFKGIFSILKIVSTLVAGPLNIAFKVITKLLGMFGFNILDVTAAIGDVIVKFEQWLSAILDFDGAFEVIANGIKYIHDWVTESEAVANVFWTIESVVGDAVRCFREWIDALKNGTLSPKEVAEGIVNGFKAIPGYLEIIFETIRAAFSEGFKNFSLDIDPDSFFGKFLNGLSFVGQVAKELGLMLLESINGVLTKHGFSEISLDMIIGFAKGIKENAATVWNAMIELGKQIIQKIKDVLGIHSPSTVFFAIGGFIIAGLISGLLSGSSNIKEAVGNLGGMIADFFGDIDFQTVFSTVISAGLLKALLDISGAIKNGVGFLDGVGDVFEGVGKVVTNFAGVVKAFKGVLKSFSMSIKAEAFKDIAIAILILVGAIFVLTKLDTGKMWEAIGAIAAIAAIMGILFMVMNAAAGGSKMENPKDFIESIGAMVKMSSMLIALSASMVLMAVALKILEGIDPENAAVAFGGLAAMVVAIAGVLAAYGTCVKGKSAQNIDKVGSMLFKLSAALLIMAIVVKILGKMDQDTLIQGGLAIAAFTGIMVGMVALTKLSGKSVEKTGTALAKMASAFVMMAVVVKILGSMDCGELIQGGIAIVAFAGIMTGMVAMTQLVGKGNIDKLGSTLLSMGGAMLMMAVVVKILGGMDTGELIKGTAAVVAFAGILTGLVAATKLASDKELQRVGTTLLLMSIAIGIMAVVVMLLGFLDVAHLAKGIVAVGMLSVFVSLMIIATKNAADCKGNLIALSIAIGILAVALVALSFLDGKKLAGAVAAMTVLIFVFTMLVTAAGKANGSLATLIVMTVAVGLLAGVIALLAQLPIEATIGSAMALSALMLAMTGVLVVLSKMSTNIAKAVMGILGLTLMAVPLLAFVGVLALMSGVENAVTNALALSTLATVLTLLLIPLCVIGACVYLTGGAILLGVVALLAMAVPMRAFVGILALMSGIEDAGKNAELLTNMMEKLTAMLIKLSIVAPLAVLAVSAMTVLTGLMVAIGVLAVGTGALMEKFPSLEQFLDKGIPILEKIAYAIGSLAGNLISGLVDTVAGSLPGLGAALSAFMINAMPFIVGIKMVDASILEGVGVLSAAVVMLSAADFVSGILSFLGGSSSFANLGTELSKFMINAMPFIAGASLLNGDMMVGVKALAETIQILTGANVVEGLTSWFTGGSGLSNFGSQLPQLGSDIAAFASSLGTFSEDQVNSVSCAANAIKELASAAESIPGEGGWIQKICGEHSIADFADKLPAVGTNLSSFVTNLGTFTDAQVTTVKCAGNAIAALADATDSIPAEGGWIQKICGEKSLSEFADDLPDLGTNLNSFVTNLGTFSEDQVTTVDCAGRAIKAMADAASSIDGQADWAKKLFGDNSLSAFGDELSSLGEDLASFVENLGTFSTQEISTVDSAVTAIKSLAQIGGTEFNAGKITTFGSNIETLGEKFSSFCDSMSDIGTETLNAVTDKIDAILDMVDSIGSTETQNLKDFGDALKDVAKTGISKFVKAFTSKASVDDIKGAGKKMLDNFIKGAESKDDDVEDAFDELAGAGVDGIEKKSNYNDFKDAGKYLAKGLIEGINAKKQAVYDAAYALGQKAVQGEKDGQASNSPSKLTIQAGKWLGEGLIEGIAKMTTKVYNSGNELGQAATNSISSAISNLSSAMDTDMDYQPTIRPVLDLSDVEYGVGTMNNMFGNKSVGVLADLNGISMAINSRNQNGGNADVVSAIDKLRDDLSTYDRTVNNINGITYDDSSSLTDAIETIIRYTKIEGRV